jgi:integrase
MPKYKHGNGSVFLRGKTYWLSYYVNNTRVRESAGTNDKTEARRKLQEKIGQRAEGRLVVGADKVSFEDMAEDFLNDYRTNGRKSLDVAQRRVKKHLARFFSGKPAHGLTTADIRAFIAARQEEGAAAGEINLELAALKRMFNLALQAGKITRKPHIPMLTLNNARQGFFEQWEFDALLSRLPPELQPPLPFAYLIGWRKNEVLSLPWGQIDLEEGAVRLEVGTTKNKAGRLVYLPEIAKDLIEQQWAIHL